MKKFSLVLFLSASLACLSQTIANSGTTTPQTAVKTAVPGPPQVVPSDVTLPGSGPPVGAPLTNTNTNDSRTGGIVQAYNPAAVIEHPVAESTAEASGSEASAPQLPFNTGLQSFAGAATTAQGPASSLGDIARQYRTQARPAARSFNNDSIAQLSGGQSLPQGREMAQLPRNPQQEMAMAAAIPPMSAGSAQNDASGNATQSGQIDQRKRTSSAAADQTAGGNNADTARAEQNSENSDRNNLPASGSELPLLALLGIAVAGGGALYRFRR